MLESGPLRSVEEANAYIKSHEIATHTKYVVAKSKGINSQDLSSLNSYYIQWEYSSGVKTTPSERINDGIPFINLGHELRDCQYGPPKKRRIKVQTFEDKEEANQQEEFSGAEKTEKNSGRIIKKRKRQPSKKLNCPSKLKIKKIMKFPEYAVEEGKEYPSGFKSKIGKQLKADFNETTKRYILVYVHIEHDHNHGAEPIEVEHKHRKIVHMTDKGCRRISEVALPNVPKRGPVLKQWASLKGRNLMDLAMQFRTTVELPEVLAQPKPVQRLEDMCDEELLSLYHDITGEMPNNMFSVANKVFTSSNLRLLLHLSIMFANADSDACRQSQTHPSVRIKGTENNFTPVQCLEIDCAVVDVHMHCPLCAKTDSYTDPDLLKTHFTNRHVDKAIEFAGLRILRCYGICEVVGKNKDCKTFKGGHWHCYKCPNGLDKRNSAFDHFQSHLKNYESSFQIQVAQDVYQSLSGYTVPHVIDVSHLPWEPYQTPTSLNTVSTTTKSGSCDGSLKRSYTASCVGELESIDHTTVYVQDDATGNVSSTYTTQEIPMAGNETYVITVPNSAELDELKVKVRELEASCQELEQKNAVQKSHIEFLQKKDADQSKLIQEYENEKQELIKTLEAQKLEKERLALTQNKVCSSSVNELNRSTKKVIKLKRIKNLDHLSIYTHDAEISVTNAEELEKNFKNSRKDTYILDHDYETRHATRTKSAKKSFECFPQNENASKQNVDNLTCAPRSSSDTSCSHPTTMEEMCHQLCNMQKEIELLKQTTLAGNTVARQLPVHLPNTLTSRNSDVNSSDAALSLDTNVVH